jgi:hypothetical protein
MILSNRYLVVAATALALAGLAAAETEFFAVLERKSIFVLPPQQSGSQGACDTQDNGFEIVSFAEHAPKTTGNCDVGGKVMGQAKSLEGCKKGDYSNGFRVCGTKVHNDKGQHQQCEKDNTAVAKCTCSLISRSSGFPRRGCG